MAMELKFFLKASFFFKNLLFKKQLHTQGKYQIVVHFDVPLLIDVLWSIYFDHYRYALSSHKCLIIGSSLMYL